MNSEKKNKDRNAFLEAMADVTPLPANNRIDPPARKTLPEARQRARDDQAVLDELLQQGDDGEDLENGEELLYLRPGCQRRLLTRLRRGHYSVGDTIDLHHMDVATARRVLADFLEQAIARRLGCVRVIHGKGLRSRNLPLLKLMTGHVLRKHPGVMAFASCRPVNGGTGATDVLLSVRPAAQR